MFVRRSLLGAVLAAIPLLQATAPPAAHAVLQIYKIGSTPFNPLTAGDFNTNVGPAQDGWFDGFIEYDSASPLNGGQPAWTRWSLNMYAKGPGNNSTPGPLIFKFASSLDIYLSGPQVGPTQSTSVGTWLSAGCFNSGDGQNPALDNLYYAGAPGTENCGPNNPGPVSTPTVTGVNSGAFALTDNSTDGISTPYCPPSLCPVNTGQDLRWINVYQQQEYNYQSGGDQTRNWHFFRYPGFLIAPNQPGGFELLTAPNTGSIATNLGWSALAGDPSAGIGDTCTGASNINLPAGSCPFSGNQQQNQNVRAGNTPSLDIVEIPAPLPLTGVVPLGIALKKMAKRRRQLLEA